MKRILLAMLMMLFVTASAYAAQKDVEVSTTRPQIVEGTCSQAGSLGLTFRDDTIFTENSTITVNFTPANVELCENIDLYWNSTTAAGFF